MSSTMFALAHTQYLDTQERGTLATVAPSGAPQNKPVGFHHNQELGTIDISGYQMERSAKFRNVGANPQVAFTVNDVPDPSAGAAGVRFMEVRGRAEQVRLEQAPMAGLAPWIIRIRPRRIVSYNVVGSGLHTADFDDEEAANSDRRPAAGLTSAVADRGLNAVERQVAELQAGLGDGDAETYNRHFAEDVMWGSPYGATVDGYDTLHRIHSRMHSSADHSHSRYQIVRVLTPAPDVTLAQVRRDELDDRGQPIPSHESEIRFSEMALYVLVRRGGSWWLAAGQNTKINIDGGAVAQ